MPSIEENKNRDAHAGQGLSGGVAALSPEQRALLILRLGRKNASRPPRRTHELPIRRAPRDAELPLSFAQQRLWFLSQLDPKNPVYNQLAAIRLAGRLSEAALESALGEILRRHEALRSNFRSAAGKPVLVIRPSGEFALPVIDLTELAEGEREGAARRLLTEEAARAFDLAHDPLIRAGLIRLGPQEHIALFILHHIVSDGWSVDVFVRELSALYEASLRGEPSPLEELPIQYVDFAHWQREFLRGEALDSQLGYWKKQLEGLRPALGLPLDRPRPAARSFRGAQHVFALSERLTADLKALSNREHVTLFMTLLAAFNVLLYRHTGETDIPVGTPVAGRNRMEIEGLIGFFINTLVLRASLDGDPTFRELLARVRAVTIGAYAHQDVPFEKIVEALEPERSLSQMPLFQVLFALQNTPASPLDLPGLRVEPVRAGLNVSKFDLALYMDERGPRLFGGLHYGEDVFEAPTVLRMAEQFETLLESVVAGPERRLSGLALVRERNRSQMISDFNDDLGD
jgi:aspartate racemase